MPLSPGDKRIHLVKTAFVIYNHVDMEGAGQFLRDFGLTETARNQDESEIFYKGYGPDPFCYIARRSKALEPNFGGAAYLVESGEELEKAAQIPGASKVSKLDAPGGGRIVTLTDPAGHLVHLVHGQTEKQVEPMQLEKLVVNFEDEKPRRGRFQRFQPGPAPVHKWGHYGVTYPDGYFQEMLKWYTTYLALAPSDVITQDDKPITMFFHIDRGEEYTDHHSFFFKPTKPGLKPHVAHSAFEVHDFDIQQLGHDYLTSKGHSLCWGVGRHVLGSQIFDYWFDPSDFVLEHYADGDLVNNKTPVGREKAGPQALAVWGPPVPPVF